MKPKFYDSRNMIKRARHTKLEIKTTEGGGRFLAGYASTFESPEEYDDYGDIFNSKSYDAFVEEFNKGNAKVVMLSQHNDTIPIGLWTAFKVDDKGLWAEGEIANTRAGDDMVELVNKGIVDSLSVGLVDVLYRDLEEMTEWGYPVREITRAKPIEVSPVTFPANEHAKI
ncbi:MAG: HK97 family phage prohead protease, partial [Rhodospirillaceae bacterium]|nr:HK97 family phage prohead protease [Rhodospirillaceae bacterium]